jgi:hypothetical protein
MVEVIMMVMVIVIVILLLRVGMRVVVMVNVWVRVMYACFGEVNVSGMVMTGVRVTSALPRLTFTSP